MALYLEVRPDVSEKEQIYHLKEQLELYLNNLDLSSSGEVITIKGDPGPPGRDGADGVSCYVYLRYSANSDGSNMTVAPQADTAYLGIQIKDTEGAGVLPADYTWCRILGTPGMSPSATVSKAGDTATISITDSQGTTSATISDGADGSPGPANSLAIGTVIQGSTPAASITGTPPSQTLNLVLPKGQDGQDGQDGRDGTDGQDGADGYSPTATVSKTGDTATITITDKNGTTTAIIKDGADGQGAGDMLKRDYDTNNDGVVDAADDSATLDGHAASYFAAASSVPTKVSDLTNDSGFLTSETDPTVPSWAKSSTKPTYTATEVGALPDTTPIPAATSDLINDSGFMTAIAGVIQMYSGSVAPAGWLICDGSEQLKSDYPKLAAVLGDTYGTASDIDHFLLPDLRGRVAVGLGDGTATGHTTHTLGQKAGNEDAIVPYHNHTHAHTHPLATSSGQVWAAASGTGATEPGAQISGSGRYYAASNATGYSWVRDTQAASTNATSYAGTNGNTTGANMQPYIGLNYIISTGEQVVNGGGGYNGNAADYVVEESVVGEWEYRKWNSGLVEAWCAAHDFGSQTGAAWGNVYYTAQNFTIPSGIFPSAPHALVTGASSQWWIVGVSSTTTTGISFRACRPASSAATLYASAYCWLKP